MNGKTKIAIVDDSAVIRDRLVQRLSKCENYELIWQADDFESALEMIDRELPDVLILDIQLPGGSGIDVLRNVKVTNPALKVIMLTNFPLLPFRKTCFKAGADYFFDKSEEFEKVFEVLKGIRN